MLSMNTSAYPPIDIIYTHELHALYNSYNGYYLKSINSRYSTKAFNEILNFYNDHEKFMLLVCAG